MKKSLLGAVLILISMSGFSQPASDSPSRECAKIVSKSYQSIPGEPNYYVVTLAWELWNSSASIQISGDNGSSHCIEVNHNGDTAVKVFSYNPNTIRIERFYKRHCTGSCGDAILLPVSYIYFKAEKQGESIVRLSWKVAIESITLGSVFKIEYSDDGETFLPIGKITSDPTKATYEFTHPVSSLSGRIYYRILEDGKYSAIAAVDLGGSKAKAYLVQVGGNVSVKPMMNGLTMELFTMAGQKVASAKGSSLNVSNFPQSIYIVRFTDGKGSVVLTEKFYKQ